MGKLITLAGKALKYARGFIRKAVTKGGRVSTSRAGSTIAANRFASAGAGLGLATRKGAGWLTKASLVVGGTWAVDAGVDVLMTSLFKDSTDNSGLMDALVYFSERLIQDQPKDMATIYQLSEIAGLWKFVDEGNIPSSPDLDRDPDPTPDPTDPNGDRIRPVGSVPPSGFSPAGNPFDYFNRQVASRARLDMSYYRDLLENTLRELIGLFNRLDGAEGSTLSRREDLTKVLTQFLVTTARLNALLHLVADSLEEVSGYPYGSVSRVLSGCLTSNALEERQILNKGAIQELLRNMVGNLDSVLDADSRYIEFLIGLAEFDGYDRNRFFPLSF